MARYIPDRGDIVWINFDPKAGHEQGGRRPAVVLSPKSYNRPAGLALLCPVTSRAKGYPFEVPLPEGGPVTGVVLADQLRSLDWPARQAELAGVLDTDTLVEIAERLWPLAGLDDD
jgi:mRNA interferase MazF